MSASNIPSHFLNADYSKYPDSEARLGRDHFTKILLGLLSTLDELSEDLAPCINVLTKMEVDTVLARVTGVWVFGSYARGAAHCGDLDVLISVASDEQLPLRVVVDERTFVKTLLGRLKPRVSVILGTPSSNEVQRDFTEAVKVWGEGVADSQKAVHAIPVAEGEASFARESSFVPMGLHQFDFLPEEASYFSDLSSMLERKQLASTFTGLSEIEPVYWSKEVAGIYYWCRNNLSVARQKLVPAALGFLRMRAQAAGLSGKVFEPSLRSNTLCCDGFEVELAPKGMPWYAQLAKGAQVNMAVMPEFSTRGPNGVWELSLGTEHILMKTLKNASLWTECQPNGAIRTVLQGDVAQRMRTCTTIKVGGADTAGTQGAQALELKGLGLIAMLTSTDAVESADNVVPLTLSAYELLADEMHFGPEHIPHHGSTGVLLAAEAMRAVPDAQVLL